MEQSNKKLNLRNCFLFLRLHSREFGFKVTILTEAPPGVSVLRFAKKQKSNVVDPGSGAVLIPGTGINIPDPQHCDEERKKHFPPKLHLPALPKSAFRHNFMLVSSEQ
jgi:hypothetical protein